MARNPYFDKIFSILKTYYNKSHKYIFAKNYIFGVMRWLSTENRKKVLEAVRKADQYINYIKDHHVSILLYFLIPRLPTPKGFNFAKVKNVEEEELHEKIRKHFGYTHREYLYIKYFVENKINNNKQDWYRKFAIKEKS